MLNSIRQQLEKLRHRLRLGRKVALAIPASSAAMRRSNLRIENERAARSIGYTLAATGLSAKLAKADGGIKKEEVESFRWFVPHLEEESRQMLFNEAALDGADFEHYARRMRAFFPEDAAFLKKTLRALFDFAAADGPINGDEIVFLKKVNDIFGFSETHFMSELKAHMMPKHKEDPYALLGIDKGAAKAEVKKAYHRALASYHPDRLLAIGSKDILAIAHQRIALVQAAYDRITRRARLH